MGLGSVLCTAWETEQKVSPNSKLDCVVQVSGQKGTKTVVHSYNAGFNAVIQPDWRLSWQHQCCKGSKQYVEKNVDAALYLEFVMLVWSGQKKIFFITTDKVWCRDSTGWLLGGLTPAWQSSSRKNPQWGRSWWPAGTKWGKPDDPMKDLAAMGRAYFKRRWDDDEGGALRYSLEAGWSSCLNFVQNSVEKVHKWGADQGTMWKVFTFSPKMI